MVYLGFMRPTDHNAPSPVIMRLFDTARLLSLAVLAVLTVLLLWHTTGDLDLLLHDRVGQDLLGGQGLPATNHFSHTAPDHRWVNHEWGFQVLVATAGQLGPGPDAHQRNLGWHWLRLALGLALVAALLADQRWGRRTPPGLLMLVGLTVLGMLWTRLILRPELLSSLLLVLLTTRIEAHLRQPGEGTIWREVLDPRRPGGQATLLALLWYQVHGFAALAPLIWLLAALLDLGAGPGGHRWRRALPGLVLALAAGIATPNGLAGLLYPLKALGQFSGQGPDWQHTISELVPLLETRGALATTLLVFKMSVAWAALWLLVTWPRRSWLRPALFGLALMAALGGQRNLGLYAVAFALLHGGPDLAVGSLWTRLQNRMGKVGPVIGLAAPAAGWVLAGLWFTALSGSQFYLDEGVARRTGTGLTPTVYPLAQARKLATVPQLRVANTVDAASSLIHTRGGRVSIDGRTEAYPAGVWQQYAAFRGGGPAALRQLMSWRAEAVCLAHRNPASHAVIRTLAASADWSLVSADHTGILFRPGRVDPAPWRRQALICRDRLQPGSPLVRVDEAAAWAGLLTLLGDVQLAEDLLRRAERAAPSHPVVLHNLGNVLMAQGDLNGALERFQAAANRNRAAAPPLVNAGNCLFNLGRPREALDSLESAVQRDPRNFEGWANLAEIRRQQGDRDGAGAAYRRALELRPGDDRLRQRARSL